MIPTPQPATRCTCETWRRISIATRGPVYWTCPEHGDQRHGRPLPRRVAPLIAGSNQARDGAALGRPHPNQARYWPAAAPVPRLPDGKVDIRAYCRLLDDLMNGAVR